MNTQDGKSAAIETPPSMWTCAVDDDLAAIHFVPPPSWAHGILSVDTFLEQSCEIDGWPIYPGDEAIFFGRFVNHEGHQRNKPVVRFGNISMMPDADAPIRVYDFDQVAFLVECRSLGGFSGSPAFVSMSGRAWMGGVKKQGLRPTKPKFLGVDCAHLPFWSGIYGQKGVAQTKIPNMWAETNSGIAVVVPAWRLLQLLNQDHFVEARKAEEASIKAEREAQSENVASENRGATE